MCRTAMCRKISLLALVLAFTAFAAYADSGEYARLARISFMDGNVSFMHPNEVDWSAASINMPLQVGDRIYTGADGRAEMEFDDGSVLRLAEKTDVEILSLKEDLIQLRILIGLTTLTTRSGVGFEVDTPAAAFSTGDAGVYRFDVAENGNTDAVVRKGTLEAANDKFTRQINSDEVIHITAGEGSTPIVARYETRDQWDEWNDRRNADTMARGSRAYVPDDVYMGVGELDRYGRWVTVADYGPAWVPSYVDPYWSPYWAGRWCYRPFWGWTWVSYEPWGWLPYHYGRWYHSAGFGWCWLPGASFGFHFWSPGLVRFYSGPSWVSWVALGPGDYYNVNQYYYNRTYAYQLNQLRVLQRRAPEDLVNRGVPGGVRTVRNEQFVSGSFGPNGRLTLVDVDQPWIRGRMVSDRLDLRPVAQSYAPAPERTAVRPEHANDRAPVVVRTQPIVNPRDNGMRILRAAPPAGVAPVRQAPGSVERTPALRNRAMPDTNTGATMPARPVPTPPADIRNNAPRDSGRTTVRPENPAPAARPSPPARNVDPGANRPNAAPAPAPRPSPPARNIDPGANRPSATPAPRTPPPERNVDRPAKPPEAQPRPKDPPSAYSNSFDSSTANTSSAGLRPSYYSREQGWVRSTPAYGGNTNTANSQPTYSPNEYRMAQPAPVSNYTVQRSYPQESAPVAQSPRSWGQSYVAPQERQYSAPRAVSLPAWSGQTGSYFSPAPGRSLSSGGVTRSSGYSGGGRVGSAVSGGRRR